LLIEVDLIKKISSNLNLKTILIIGLFQILSLIPGVSRAGITITAARILKFNRVDSSKISFLLSIPALAGASFLSLKNLTLETIEYNMLVLVAIFYRLCFLILQLNIF
jgi:undecaprenyl-diphosphatase